MAAARQNLTGISADRTLAEALLFRPRRGRSEGSGLRFGSTRAAPDAALLGDVGVPGTESVDMTPSSLPKRRPLPFTFIMDTINDNPSRVEAYKPEAYF
jgi:hypothetical protein